MKTLDQVSKHVLVHQSMEQDSDNLFIHFLYAHFGRGGAILLSYSVIIKGLNHMRCCEERAEPLVYWSWKGKMFEYKNILRRKLFSFLQAYKQWNYNKFSTGSIHILTQLSYHHRSIWLKIRICILFTRKIIQFRT